MKLLKRSAAIGVVVSHIYSPLVNAENISIEEVVVTAQTRIESAQDVPLSVTAINAKTLDIHGVQEFTDLTRLSSSLTVQEGDNKTNSPVSIRGVGTYSFSMGIEPSVLVLIDEIPVARQAQAFSNLVDIERIEILRGPAATLEYGSAAADGVIRIYTKRGGGDSATPDSSASCTN